MFLVGFARFFRQWRAYDVIFRSLSRHDDRALAVMGIRRQDIARVAWQRAESIA